MSVLVKGWKMPSGCITCVFESEGPYDWTMWCQWLDDPLGEFGKRDGKWRHPDCPLAEVPTPHGPMIDMNEALHTFSELEPYRRAFEKMVLIEAEEEA